MTRFDCPEYVAAWQATGKFPPIHRDIVNMVKRSVAPADGAVLDLGSSTGLLTRQLADAGFTVWPVEASRASAASGKLAGVYRDIEVTRWKLTPADMTDLMQWIQDHEIKIVVARRVFPELDDFGVYPRLLSESFLDGGVRHLFVEGRVYRPNAKHRLHSLENEIAALGEDWEVIENDGFRAHLVPVAP